MMEDLGEINTFFPLSELELLYVHTIISFWYKKKKKDSDILWKHSDLASHGILKAYYWGTDSKFGGLTPGREIMVFSIYPWTLQLVRLLSVSNYTEQMRDFLIFFLFDLQLNKICLFYFWLKNDEAAPTPVSPQSCWFFFPLLPNLFQTTSVESHFSGNHLQPRPSGALSAVYFVKYKFKIVVRWVFFFLSFKLCNKKVHLLLLGNRFKAKEKKGWVWRSPKVSRELQNQW